MAVVSSLSAKELYLDVAVFTAIQFKLARQCGWDKSRMIGEVARIVAERFEPNEALLSAVYLFSADSQELTVSGELYKLNDSQLSMLRNFGIRDQHQRAGFTILQAYNSFTRGSRAATIRDLHLATDTMNRWHAEVEGESPKHVCGCVPKSNAESTAWICNDCSHVLSEYRAGRLLPPKPKTKKTKTKRKT